MMFTMFAAEDVRNEQKRNHLMEKYDCIEHLNSANVRQFICYGSKDHVVNTEQSRLYIKALRQAAADITVMELDGADHGFGVSKKMNRKTDRWVEPYVEWLLSDSQ